MASGFTRYRASKDTPSGTPPQASVPFPSSSGLDPQPGPAGPCPPNPALILPPPIPCSSLLGPSCLSSCLLSPQWVMVSDHFPLAWHWRACWQSLMSKENSWQSRLLSPSSWVHFSTFPGLTVLRLCGYLLPSLSLPSQPHSLPPLLCWQPADMVTAGYGEGGGKGIPVLGSEDLKLETPFSS